MIVLIVEDEALVATDMEATIEDLGYSCVGVAADAATALKLAQHQPDIALVDLNLRDGATGPQIGGALSAQGVAVVFITANPRQLGNGVPGTLGVVNKPCDEDGILSVLDYAARWRRGEPAKPPPQLFAFS